MVQGCRAPPDRSSSRSPCPRAPLRCATGSLTRWSAGAALRGGSPGDPLPSTRVLAADLGLSRGPVVAAYDELAAAGFVLSRAGSGAVVAPGAGRAAAAGALSHVPTAGGEAVGIRSVATAPPPLGPAPGRPDTTLLDAAAWRRARRAAGTAVAGDAGAGPSHEGLRRVLADHLRRSRGVAVAPDDLLVERGDQGVAEPWPAPGDSSGPR